MTRNLYSGPIGGRILCDACAGLVDVAELPDDRRVDVVLCTGHAAEWIDRG